MKPRSLESHNRIRERQDAALEAIRLAHEKEAWVPIEPFEVLLPTQDIQDAYREKLEGNLGKQ